MKKLLTIVFAAFVILELISCTAQKAFNSSSSQSTTGIADPNSTFSKTVTFRATTSTFTTSTATPDTDIIYYTPTDSDLVRIRDYIPDIYIHLPYATKDNFTKTVIYDFDEPFLRYGTVKKLQAVQNELRKDGLSLMIYDGFRPVSAQFKLWDAFPDPTFISNPNKGYSSHSRGNTVDLTVTNQNGEPLEMPSEFDCFTSLADRDYSDCSQEAAKNALLLENLMKKCGFKPYSAEWWHFTDKDDYPVENNLDLFQSAPYRAECKDYIALLSLPSSDSAEIIKIPSNRSFTVYGQNGEFYFINYKGIFGYVLKNYAVKQ